MTHSEDQIWMREALACAQKAYDQNEVPVGAVVVLNNQIIGRGWNQPISNHDATAHAEVMAIRAASQNIQNYRLVDAALYVTIEPCAMCFGALVHARIKKLVYGAPEPKSGVIYSNLNFPEQTFLNHSVEIEKDILAEESTALIQQFFKMRRALKKKV